MQGGKGRSRPPAPCQTNRGHLLGRSAIQAKYPGHGWSNAPVQPDPQHLTLEPVGLPWQRCRLYPARANKKPHQNSGRVTFVECGKKYGVHPREETPATPDEPGDSTPMMGWKGLGYILGVELSSEAGCLVLSGGRVAIGISLCM